MPKNDEVAIPAFGPPPEGLDPEKLDRYLAYEDQPDDHPVARWSISNDGAAEWALRKLAGLEAELSDVERQAGQWIEDITSWAAERGASLHRSAEFFRGHLSRYGLARRELTGHATLHLPTGNVATRAGNPRAYISDQDLVIRSLKRLKRPDLVRTREDVLISQLLEDEQLAARFVEVPTTWKVGLDCGCVVYVKNLLEFRACPSCDQQRPSIVDTQVEDDGYWQLWVTIDGKDVQLPGVGVDSPITTATVKLR